MSSLKLSIIQPTPSEYEADVWSHLFATWIEAIQADFSGIIQVSFVSQQRMREFYLEAYGEDHATDVLSLRHELQPGMKDGITGEIVICPAVARKAAHSLKTDARTEFAQLFVHGLLHLAGYVHDTPAEQDRFHELTHDIMATQYLEAISLWSV